MDRKVVRIALYFLIAAGISFVFRVLSPVWFENLTLPFGLTLVKGWFLALGPLLGAVIVSRSFKLKRETTLFGNMKLTTIIIFFVPVLALTILGIDTGNGFNPHYTGFLLGIMIAVYGILEESGWRGYLQDELKDINPWFRYLITGLLWYLWHFTFLGGQFNFMNELIIFFILFLSSLGLGKIAESTRSIGITGCFHALGNILGLSTVFQDHAPSEHKFLIVGICLIVWIPLLIFEQKKTKQDQI